MNLKKQMKLHGQILQFRWVKNFKKNEFQKKNHRYIGESARVIREMFAYARSHEPCIIFMDEIDAIGGKRFNQGMNT